MLTTEDGADILLPQKITPLSLHFSSSPSLSLLPLGISAVYPLPPCFPSLAVFLPQVPVSAPCPCFFLLNQWSAAERALFWMWISAWAFTPGWPRAATFLGLGNFIYKMRGTDSIMPLLSALTSWVWKRVSSACAGLHISKNSVVIHL